MTKPIFFHVYVSAATREFSPEDLLQLLTKSRERNARAGLTGLLLYKNNDFMQLLEGPEQAVREVLRKIEADPRHRQMTKLLEGFTAERQFPDWHMGFTNLDSATAKATPGYSEFLQTPLAVGLAAEPSACQRLLHLFKQRPR